MERGTKLSVLYGRLQEYPDKTFLRMVGVGKRGYHYVRDKWLQYRTNKEKERRENGNNLTGAGAPRKYCEDDELTILLLHYKRDMRALDIAFMIGDQEEIIQTIINRVEGELREALGGEITMKTKEERLELAKKYNEPQFHNNTLNCDGTLLITRKPENKAVQGDNWSHKQTSARNYQVGCLQNGEIGKVSKGDSGVKACF